VPRRSSASAKSEPRTPESPPSEARSTVEPPPGSVQTIVRLSTEQVAFAQQLAATAGLAIVSAAGPSSGATATIADALGCARSSDFRHDVFHAQPDLVLLLSSDDLGDDGWSALEETGIPTISLEPRAAGITDMRKPRPHSSRIVQSPLVRSLSLLHAFDESRESFGPVRSVNIAMRCRRTHGSLYARLTDAVDIMERLCGPAVLVDASMSGPMGSPPDSLRAMHGHLTVNARFSENCCACIHVSDLGAVWSRGITILGDGACIRLTDHAFEWRDETGELVDRSIDESVRGDDGGSSTPMTCMVRDIRRVLSPNAASLSQPEPERIVPVCEAIRLSLRTGQAETPRKFHDLITG